jgi:hypothetical protein
MDDAHTPVPAVPAIFEEPPHAGAAVCRRLAVQVGPVFGGVRSALQLSDLAPVDAGRSEVRQTVFRELGGRHRFPRGTDCRRCANAATRIRAKRHDVRHLAFECLGVRLVVEISSRHVGWANWLLAVLHRNNCSPRPRLALRCLWRVVEMRFIHLFLVGYFILVVGLGMALWQTGVLSRVAPIWIAIGALVAIGLGIMLAVTSGKPDISEEVTKRGG